MQRRPAAPCPEEARPVPFIGAFESTFLPGHGIDVAETSQHSTRWRDDLDADLRAGVMTFRYPLRWHRIEAEPGSYDWTDTDAALGHLREQGADPIVDLVHHTSYPAWLVDGFRDPRFPASYVAFAEAVAHRYSWLRSYTLFNEPFATLHLAGHEALWPPYDRGVEGLVRLANTVLPAISAASECVAELLPTARHFWVDTCEHHSGSPGGPAAHAAMANDRRHALLDLALGRHLDPSRPVLQALLRAGGEPLFDLRPVKIDVLGLDYYCHSEWWYDEHGGRAPSPRPVGFAAIAEHYAERYGLPMVLSETNLRGLPSDRASWLRYMLEQYELAVSRGVPLEGFCWFPSVDSCDWDSMLARPAGRIDPVGVSSLGPDGQRVRTRFTDVWESAVAGARASELPAYRFQPPCDAQLAGYLDQLGHWPWQDPPPGETPPAIPVPAKEDPMTASAATPSSATSPEPTPVTSPAHEAHLVVLSHLRWTWVWQRPQHLVSRFAARRAAGGAQTWFVEEPVYGDLAAAELRTEQVDGLTRVWLVLPRHLGQGEGHGQGQGQGQSQGQHLGFDAPAAAAYGRLLATALARAGVREPDVLLYTPMALDIAEELSPARLFYDVMDDLASFLGAPDGLVLRQRRTLQEADVVFTGGRSLHRSVAQHRSGSCHLFPSGVETAHYAASRSLRVPHERPVAGYVGVIDERVDLALVADLAAALPDWTIRMVGPVAKIDEAVLPRADNLEFPGRAAYEDLPAVMAGFDVALMPFALNDATRSISPTKTLEYLAAGLPVVSTRVADVVTDYQDVVHFADDGPGFAEAARHVMGHARTERDRKVRRISRDHEWDVIAERMAHLMATATAPPMTEAHA